jgi:hypothetical protein
MDGKGRSSFQEFLEFYNSVQTETYIKLVTEKFR